MKQERGRVFSVTQPPKNRLIKLLSDESLESSGHSDFYRAVEVTTDRSTEWETVSKITEPYNNYPCSSRPYTKLTIVYKRRRLGGVSPTKTPIHAIAYTWSIHGMDTNYESFLSYHWSPIYNFSTLGNGAQELIAGYGTTLVILGVKVVEKRKVFHVPGLSYHL